MYLIYIWILSLRVLLECDSSGPIRYSQGEGQSLSHWTDPGVKSGISVRVLIST